MKVQTIVHIEMRSSSFWEAFSVTNIFCKVK